MVLLNSCLQATHAPVDYQDYELLLHESSRLEPKITALTTSEPDSATWWDVLPPHKAQLRVVAAAIDGVLTARAQQYAGCPMSSLTGLAGGNAKAALVLQDPAVRSGCESSLYMPSTVAVFLNIYDRVIRPHHREARELCLNSALQQKCARHRCASRDESKQSR